MFFNEERVWLWWHLVRFHTPLHTSELGNLTRWHPIEVASKIPMNLHRICNPVGGSDLVFLFKVYFLKSGK